jgi:hypothetical protein
VKKRHKSSPGGVPRSGPARRRTKLPGQKPKAKDAPDQDVHHDERRQNPFDPAVDTPSRPMRRRD